MGLSMKREVGPASVAIWGNSEARNPAARGKVYRIGQWSNLEVPDPNGQSDNIFKNVLLLVDRGVADWVSKLEQGN